VPVRSGTTPAMTIGFCCELAGVVLVVAGAAAGVAVGRARTRAADR
jgi:hypothetical protein